MKRNINDDYIEWFNIYFPKFDKVDSHHDKLLKDSIQEPKQIRVWGRSAFDADKYWYSLYLTACALVSGKNVLLVGKFSDKVINDLKERYKIEVTREEETSGIGIKLKNII